MLNIGTDELSREPRAGHHSRRGTLGLCTPWARVSAELLVVPSAAIQKFSLILFHHEVQRDDRKFSEGCWHCPFGDAGHGCSAGSSLTTCVGKKGFSSLKTSSWCLESVCGSVCLRCNLNLILRGLCNLSWASAVTLEQLPSPQCPGSW